MAMMDPERVRAYLQVACAGLGFQVGEVWWTSNDIGSSTVAAIEERSDDHDAILVSNGNATQRKRRLRFLQLYTSKAYDDRRDDLVQPPSEERTSGKAANLVRRNSAEELGKHVLSPRLVDAVTNTAQVVWANCQRREGLLGRSDMRLQTAVGMPVAMDAEGNMCIVVMFSADNVQSSDEAMDYLRNICKSAASASIPCLLPVINSEEEEKASDEKEHQQPGELHKRPPSPGLGEVMEFGEGVTARCVSFENVDATEVHKVHEVTQAPKDCFGIPMLPTVAELGNEKAQDPGGRSSSSPPEYVAFDEASYGVWSTVMNTPMDGISNGADYSNPAQQRIGQITAPISSSSRNSSSSTVSLMSKPIMPSQRKERLEEFSSAFLGMSVFDAADVWIPCGGDEFDMLCHVTSVSATDKNDALNHFKQLSEGTTIKIWSGAAGRAYGSGNPVWSANADVIVDTDRAAAFQRAKIRSALAVPVFSSGAVTPSCVLCCYSLVKCNSVPFVLRFVQQAMRLLWEGLDRVEPHESVGKVLWGDVAPADLGEMAADVEMQNAFMKKKRPHDFISSNGPSEEEDTKSASVFAKNVKATRMQKIEERGRSSSLSMQLESLNMPSGESSAPPGGNPLPPPGVCLGPAPILPNTLCVLGNKDPQSVGAPPVSSQSNISSVQIKVQEAVRSVSDGVWWPVHRRVPTNAEGTKQAHLVTAPNSLPPTYPPAQQMQMHGCIYPEQQTSVVHDPTAQQRVQIQPQPEQQQQQTQSQPLHQQVQPQPQPLPQHQHQHQQVQPQSQCQQQQQQVLGQPTQQEQQLYTQPLQQHHQVHAQQQPQQLHTQPLQQQLQVQDQPQPQQLQVQAQSQHQQQLHTYPQQQYQQQQQVHTQPQQQQQQQVHTQPQQPQQMLPHLQVQPQAQPNPQVLSQQQQVVQPQAQPNSQAHLQQQQMIPQLHQPQSFPTQGQSEPQAQAPSQTQMQSQPTVYGKQPQENFSSSSQPQLQSHSHFSGTSPQPPTLVHGNIQEEKSTASSREQSHEAQTGFKEDPAVAWAYIEEFNAMVGTKGGVNNTSVRMQESHPSQVPMQVQSWGNNAQTLQNVNPSCLPATPSQDTHTAPTAHSLQTMLPDTNVSQSSSLGALPPTMNTIDGLLCLPSGHGVGAGHISIQGSGKPCRIQGCNDFAVARRPYCLKHSGNRMCERDGCTKCAQGSTRFCIAHGGGRRCTFPGCDKGARDKFFCAAHGGGKRCGAEGCNKSAVGGSNLCTSHGGGRRCQVEGCEKSAQSSTKFCVKHGGGKKCVYPGCDKVARGRTIHCAAHGGGVRCKLEGCNRVAIGKLQLCRAHGGGSNLKKNADKGHSQTVFNIPGTPN